MSEQLSLFEEEPQQKRKPERQIDRRLSEYALVYMVTKAGGWAGNLFVLSVEDAKTLCSDECSRGWGQGGPWHFQWTTIDHFAHMNDTYDGRRPSFEFIKDTGKQDGDFARLGIRKPGKSVIFDMLFDMGYIAVER